MAKGRGREVQKEIERDQKKLENHLIVVDTDVVIDFFRDSSPAADVFSKLISLKEAAVTVLTVFELYAGIEGTKRLQQIETLIQDLIVLPLDSVGAAAAGRIYTHLKSRGRLVGTHDILIGAICTTNGLPLYTKNLSHFSGIEGLRLLSSNEILSSQTDSDG
jgi:predicted nucleic acid-binding protein